jgi:hypothetical protein
MNSIYIIISTSCNQSTAFIVMLPSASDTVHVSSVSNPVSKALDDISSQRMVPDYQYGKNNHVEYKSINTSLDTLQEKIVQFSFQLVRTSSGAGITEVAKDTREILNVIMSGIKTADRGSDNYKKCVDMGVIMFKLLAQTRDIISGKGEYMLFYVMLLEWAKVDFRFFEYVIETLVYDTQDADGDEGAQGDEGAKSTNHPLGSWKDMKYFLTYMKEQLLGSGSSGACVVTELNRQMYSKFVDKVVNFINEQLRIDAVNLEKGGTSFSLAARWVPREKSKKFGWLYFYLAINYSHNQIPLDMSHPSYERAVNRAFMIYRKVISAINKKIDTTQVKQCNGNWDEIDFNNVTSITMHKQTNSFLNLKKDGKTDRCNIASRITCKHNYQEYLQDVVSGKSKIKGKCVSLIDFVKSAIDYKINCLPSDSPVVTALNEQWKSNSLQNNNLGNFIAMTDLSGSMTEDNCNPLHSAIGLSIRVAEKSVLGQRILTFSERPTWIQLGTQDSDTFVKQVTKVMTSSWGMTTDFYLALDLIREGIEDNKLSREVAENLVLVVFSDMQMNSASTSISDLSARATLFDNINQMFAKMGERLYGEPCKAPHIVFWNLRKTTGFPSLSTDHNVSMMSGFSPALLNVFCEKGLDGIQYYTPWNTLLNSLRNKRYDMFDRVFKQIMGL